MPQDHSEAGSGGPVNRWKICWNTRDNRRESILPQPLPEAQETIRELKTRFPTSRYWLEADLPIEVIIV